MFKNLKLHDKVFCIRHGWGTVSYIDENCPDSLCYKYKSDNGENSLWFDVHGKLWEDDHYPSIFWDIPQFTVPKRPLPVDTPIWVRDSNNEAWVKRRFKAYADFDGVYTWSDGVSSSTAKTPFSFSYWKQWKLPDEE